MENLENWMWLVKTSKGEFFITVIGKWTQEEAAVRVRGVFEIVLKVEIIDMIPRKRSTSPSEIQCTIFEQQEKKDEVGFDFFAGKKVWEICGRGTEFEAALAKGSKRSEAER